MYSPRISDDLIPQVYRAAHHAGIPMTTWVNQVIEQALAQCTEPEREQGANGQGAVATQVTNQIQNQRRNVS